MARPQTIRAFGRAARTYNSVGPALFSYFAARLVDFADTHEAVDVLDVATGSGAVLLEAASRLSAGRRFVGVDVTEPMLRRAAAEADRRGLRGIELYRMDAEALDFDDASFDLVLCGFAFSSFPSKQTAAEEFARVLRPGGTLCISDAFGWYFDQDPRWRWHRELLEAAGSPIEESEFGSTDLDELLLQAGLANPTTKQAEYELIFSDEQEWWAWSWSHGTRLLLDAIGPAKLDKFRAAAFAELRAARGQDGAITATMNAVMTRAGKPR